MSEAARSRRDDARYEPQTAVAGRDGALQGAADPLAELARLVGQDDPFRNVFRPPAAGAADPAPRHRRDAPYPVANDHHHAAEGHDGPWGDGHPDATGDGYPEDDAHAYDAGRPHGFAHHDGAPYDKGRYAEEGEVYPDEAGIADERFVDDAAAASTLSDAWARGDEPVPGAVPPDHGAPPYLAGSDRRSSARRPLAVLAAVLVLTGGGLAASFLAKGPAAPGASAAGSGRGAPTIMAATGPTKVKVEDSSATTPEDQDAALLNKNGKVSSGPVRIVSSEEQPADLGQLPKSADLADGARALPPPSPSPFPEPKKVKTFVVHPDGSMMSADGAPVAADQGAATQPAGADALGAAVPATPKTAARGGTTPKSAPPPVTIASLSADPAPADAGTASKPPRQPASPGARPAGAKPNDTADAPTGTARSFGVQLASSPVEADANAAFAKLKKRFPGQLGSLTATVHKAETGDKPVYRVRVGGMGQDEARALCSQLQGAGGSCFVVHN